MTSDGEDTKYTLLAGDKGKMAKKRTNSSCYRKGITLNEPQGLGFPGVIISTTLKKKADFSESDTAFCLERSDFPLNCCPTRSSHPMATADLLF